MSVCRFGLCVAGPGAPAALGGPVATPAGRGAAGRCAGRGTGRSRCGGAARPVAVAGRCGIVREVTCMEKVDICCGRGGMMVVVDVGFNVAICNALSIRVAVWDVPFNASS